MTSPTPSETRRQAALRQLRALYEAALREWLAAVLVMVIITSACALPEVVGNWLDGGPIDGLSTPGQL